MTINHIPVLLDETIYNLNIDPKGIYVDCTFGLGGHTQAILEKLSTGKVIAIDKDNFSIEFGMKKFQKEIKNHKLILINKNFSEIINIIKNLSLFGKINGLLIDAGLSSGQLNSAERGFSFMKEGPLDMRMDQTQKLSAYHIVNYYKKKDLSNIFKNFGEEKHSLKIAEAITKYVCKKKINNTLILADLIEKTIGRKEKKHPATRCFQALRIYINQEILELSKVLSSCFEILCIRGRIVIIGFQSLEHRIIKQKMQNLISLPKINNLQIQNSKVLYAARWIEKKLKPTRKEILTNRRSRSAILRSIEKL